MDTIIITLNGEVREIAPETDLAYLLEILSLAPQRIAVELNGVVVSRSDWPETKISDNDKVEVVHFVGGG
ncbi:MAG: sulfur carrier protein ThiS [Pyrinomonadaceae bacterium]